MFFVMSQDMKKRVLQAGFVEGKIKVLPVSIDVKSIGFYPKHPKKKGVFNIISVGRFVEKKGFDDLLKALVIVKRELGSVFKCQLVGGGKLEPKLRAMVRSLKLEKEVCFDGYMKIEDIIALMKNMDLFIQPSKTAKDGDME